ncbi:MAG: hypothetical protein PF487_02825 [Bacteroidales bacterium]|jgi:hypothetical protein|nr:hypothetical protein [Bacteroidales bacterium]
MLLPNRLILYTIFIFFISLVSCKKNYNSYDTLEVDSLLVETNNLISRVYSIDINKIDSVLILYEDSLKIKKREDRIFKDSVNFIKLQRTVNWYYSLQDEINLCQEELQLIKEDYKNHEIVDSIYIARLKREKKIVKNFEIRIDTSLRKVQSDIYIIFGLSKN